MKFKVGQTVKLVKNSSMGADLGATAIVLHEYGEFIVIKWKMHSNNQTNGSYYSTRFESAFTKNQQLLFNFMD